MRRTEPPVQIPSTVRPNIRRRPRPHSECWHQSWPEDMHGRVGDVRYCPHGRVQVRRKVPEHFSTQGPGTDYWADLSRFLNRKEHRAAVAALEGSPK